jgi:hypothetical protein
MRNLLILFVLTLVGCPCKQTGVVYPPSACTEGASTCMNDRPYSCGGGVWRPIGTVESCASVGGVCCMDSIEHVHACVAQIRCVPETDAGAGGQ